MEKSDFEFLSFSVIEMSWYNEFFEDDDIKTEQKLGTSYTHVRIVIGRDLSYQNSEKPITVEDVLASLDEVPNIVEIINHFVTRDGEPRKVVLRIKRESLEWEERGKRFIVPLERYAVVNLIRSLAEVFRPYVLGRNNYVVDKGLPIKDKREVRRDLIRLMRGTREHEGLGSVIRRKARVIERIG